MTQNYEQAVAREAELRQLGYLQIAEPLCGLPQVALTWRHVTELSVGGNSFFTGSPSSAESVRQYLWRLHPAFTRPDGSQPNRSARAHRASLITQLLARWRVARVAFDPRIRAVVEYSIAQRILDSYLDSPKPDSGAEAASSLSARMKWFEFFARYYASKGRTADDVLDMPVALCFQLLRAHYITTGEADTRCIPPSAALIRFED